MKGWWLHNFLNIQSGIFFFLHCFSTCEEKREVREEISNLAANINEEEIITVRRNHLWSDFSRARNDYYSLVNPIKNYFLW